MNAILKQLLTGLDGETHDIARWLAMVAVLTFLGLTVYEVVWLKGPWQMQEFGIGLGAVFTAAGAFIKLKESQEPK